MPAELKPEWLVRLRRSVPGADLRFNWLIWRWEFILPSADGVPRSQFWGRFYYTKADGTRQMLPPNEVTGLHDYRDLDDAGIEEACANLERTFIGNRYDGAGTTRREVRRRMRYNDELRASRYKAAGELWADMFIDRLPRMRATQQETVLIDLQPKPNPGAKILGPDGKPVTAADRQAIRRSKRKAAA